MEHTFNEAGVSITRTALASAGQVFPLRDIEDVHVVTVRRNRVVPIALSAAGAALAVVGGLYGSAAALVCGAMLIVVGWLTWLSQDVTYRLIVVTGGERREALTSVDRPFVERVERVLRAAIARKPAAAPTASRSA